MFRLYQCSTSAAVKKGAAIVMTCGREDRTGNLWWTRSSGCSWDRRLWWIHKPWTRLWCEWSERFTGSLHSIGEVQRQGCGLWFEKKLSSSEGSEEEHMHAEDSVQFVVWFEGEFVICNIKLVFAHGNFCYFCFCRVEDEPNYVLTLQPLHTNSSAT